MKAKRPVCSNCHFRHFHSERCHSKPQNVEKNREERKEKRKRRS